MPATGVFPFNAGRECRSDVSGNFSQRGLRRRFHIRIAPSIEILDGPALECDFVTGSGIGGSPEQSARSWADQGQCATPHFNRLGSRESWKLPEAPLQPIYHNRAWVERVTKDRLSEGFPEVPRAERGLRRLPVTEAHGFIWMVANADDDRMPDIDD